MKRALRLTVLLLLLPVVAFSQQRMNRPPTHVLYPYLHENDVILFQGDAITDGGRQRSGANPNRIMGQNYSYLLASQIGADIPERNLHFLNRAVSGDRVTDLAARWHDDTIALKPNVLSILIGMNDQLSAQAPLSAEEFETAYSKLLAETIAALPNTKIVLGEPFLLPVGKHQPNYSQELADLKKRQAAVDRLGTKYHLPVIHYQEVFDDAQVHAPAPYWTIDGIHPTAAGHAIMAREWIHVTNTAWGN